jgi:hypothetical protein
MPMEGAVGRSLLILLTLGCCLALTACAGQPPGEAGAPHFWEGLGHGLIAPIAFVIGLFQDEVRMYAFPNAGRWYDFGFLIGLSLWGGGGSAAAARR